MAVKLVPSDEGTCSIDLVSLLVNNEPLEGQEMTDSLQK